MCRVIVVFYASCIAIILVLYLYMYFYRLAVNKSCSLKCYRHVGFACPVTNQRRRHELCFGSHSMLCGKCLTSSKTQTDGHTNGQTPGIEFVPYKITILMIFLTITDQISCIYWMIPDFYASPI